MALPHDSKSRKAIPIYSGVLAYFPDAIAAVAEVSKIGNDQHNPGEPLHWDRDKSMDHEDCVSRHLTDHATGVRRDPDGGRVMAKVAWRALAALQLEIEEEQKNVTNTDTTSVIEAYVDSDDWASKIGQEYSFTETEHRVRCSNCSSGRHTPSYYRREVCSCCGANGKGYKSIYDSISLPSGTQDSDLRRDELL